MASKTTWFLVERTLDVAFKFRLNWNRVCFGKLFFAVDFCDIGYNWLLCFHCSGRFQNWVGSYRGYSAHGSPKFLYPHLEWDDDFGFTPGRWQTYTLCVLHAWMSFLACFFLLFTHSVVEEAMNVCPMFDFERHGRLFRPRFFFHSVCFAF